MKMILTFKSAGTFDLVVSDTGAVCSNGGGPSVMFGGNFGLLARSTLDGVGVVLADQEDLTIEETFDEISISSSCFVLPIPEGSPDGKEDGPFVFKLPPLWKVASAGDENAVDGEHDEDGDEEAGFDVPKLVVPFERGPPEATPAGNVYEHWYVDLPPRVRSSRMAKTDNSNLSIILHDVVDVVIVKKFLW